MTQTKARTLLVQTVRSMVGVVTLAIVFFVIILRVLPDTLDVVTREATAASSEDAIIIFNNLVYPGIEADLALDSRTPAAPISRTALERVDGQVRAFAQGTNITKLKIFNLRGMVIYSTEPAQIGSQFSEGTEAFLHATRGRSFSELRRVESHVGMRGTITDAILSSTYIPIRDRGNSVVGVAEIYVDSSHVYARVNQEKSRFLAIIIVGFAGLGAATFWAVWTQVVRLRSVIRIEAG